MANDYIDGLNAALQQQGASWQAGESEVTELSREMQDLLLGYNPDPASGELPLAIRESMAAMPERQMSANLLAFGAPASYDLRNVGGRSFVTAVRNQLSCGSCVSFGSIAAVEITTRVSRNDPSFAIDLSENHLFNCIARSQGRNCANGWWVDPAMRALRDQGVVDEGCSPYSPADTQCVLCGDWQSRLTKIASYAEIRSIPDMKTWLSSKGALAGCFTVYDDFFAYRTGVYRRASNVVRGGHCICVVGYDDAQSAWICKNSWGPGWGQAGFFLIGYGECGIDASMWGVTVGAGPTPGGRYVPLYRYWNPGIGDHFYTTNWGELGSGKYGWGFEGVQCYVAPSPAAGLVPLYRYWNPGNGDHFYTTNWGELGSGKYGWGFEGVQCYVAPSQLPGTVPLHRYWNPGNGDHFYTTSWSELGGGAYGWGYEGVQCYVWQAPAGAAEQAVPDTFQTSTSSMGGPTMGTLAAPSGEPFGAGSFTTASMTGIPSSFDMDSKGDAGRPKSFASSQGGGKGGCGCGGRG